MIGVVLTQVRGDQAQVHVLPGRDSVLYIRPETDPAMNMTVGFATFPEGSAPEGYVHPIQDEIIYIVSEQGELVTPEGTAELEPGTAVYITVGLHSPQFHMGRGPWRWSRRSRLQWCPQARRKATMGTEVFGRG
jgi:hypothetical protein